MVGVCLDNHMIAVVYEQSLSLTLYDQIHDPTILFSTIQIIQMASCICDALGFLHAHGLSHLNLKSQSIFVRASYRNILH